MPRNITYDAKRRKPESAQEHKCLGHWGASASSLRVRYPFGWPLPPLASYHCSIFRQGRRAAPSPSPLVSPCNLHEGGSAISGNGTKDPDRTASASTFRSARWNAGGTSQRVVPAFRAATCRRCCLRCRFSRLECGIGVRIRECDSPLTARASVNDNAHVVRLTYY